MKKATSIAANMLFVDLFSPQKFNNISSFPTTLSSFSPQKAVDQQQSASFLANINAVNKAYNSLYQSPHSRRYFGERCIKDAGGR
jgi:hypothetical protein